MVAAVAGAVATVDAAVIAFAGVRAANAFKKLEQDTRSRELVTSSLEFLTGGTQKRTVGLAMLSERVAEGLISRKAASFILKGQIKHLEDPDNKDGNRPIEQHNLQEMKRLLVEWQKSTEI